MKTIALFNNKGGVGKTSLVYHLAWMFADLGLRVVAADLDPQSNLTTMFIDEDELETLWPDRGPGRTVLTPLLPLLEGVGGIGEPELTAFDGVALVAGDLGLSGFEDELSSQWPKCLDGDKRAFRVIGAFHEILARAAAAHRADLVLIDVGPNLGAINRAALLAADHIIIPIAADLFSLKGLQNLGPRVREWRRGWEERRRKMPSGVEGPHGSMEPLGYIVMQHAVRLDRPVKAYQRWVERIPYEYRESVLGDDAPQAGVTTDRDPLCLALLKHYRSLMPMAQEARKPMFRLTPADGAIGGHAQAVQRCREHFETLARQIASRAGLSLSTGAR